MASDPRAWLAEVQERASRATEGPWHEEPHSVALIVADTEGYSADGSARAIAETVYTAEDRSFIAHARTEHPAMAAALKAVMDLHEPTPGYWGEEVCAECSDDDSRLEYSHPCPTVRAITEHLNGEDE